MAAAVSSSALTTPSFMKNSRNTICGSLSQRNVHFNSCIPSSQSFGDFANYHSSVNNNHSKARLEFLSARSTTNPESTNKDKIKLMDAPTSEHLLMPKYESSVDQDVPLTSNESAKFCQLMIQKYSGTNTSVPMETYNPKSYESILRKYSATNGEDIMRKYGAGTINGDIMRKYSVSEYDTSMKNYNEKDCLDIMQKYNQNEMDLSTLISRKRSQDQTDRKVSKESYQGLRKPSSATVNNIENKSNKVNHSATAVRVGSRKTSNMTVPNHTPHVQTSSRQSVNLTRSSSLVKPRKAKSSSSTNKGAAVRRRMDKYSDALRIDHSTKLRPKPYNYKGKSQHFKKPANREAVHRPVPTSSGNGYGGEGFDLEYVKRLLRKDNYPLTLGSGANAVTICENDFLEEDDSFPVDSRDSGVRLQHLLHLQDKASTYSPSTPVDRKELGKYTPHSIYEKMESENRGGKRKTGSRTKSKGNRYYPKSWNSHALDRAKFNRLENQRASNIPLTLESRTRMGSRTHVHEETETWVPGSTRWQSSQDLVNDPRYQANMALAESQQRAYEVYYGTGQRATKPGDTMQIVKYLRQDDDTAYEGNNGKVGRYQDGHGKHHAVNKGAENDDSYQTASDDDDEEETEDSASDVGTSFRQTDFVSDYRRLQRQLSSDKHPAFSSRGSLGVRTGSGKSVRHRRGGKSLNSIRRRSVSTWLHKRGVCTRF